MGDGASVEEYRFHPLFRDFLLRRLRSEIGQAGVAEQRNRIAANFLDRGQWEMALPYLVEAENFEKVAAVIAEKGHEWIAAGAFTSLGLFAGQVPTKFLEMFPRSLLHQAEVARLQGETDRSSALLNRAVKLLHESGDAAGEAEALHSLASLARRKGNTGEAIGLLERAEALAAPDSETFLKCANTRGLCLIVEGKRTEAELESGSGDITVELVGVPSNLDVETGSGDIVLRLPASTGAQVSIETSSGRIESDFTMQVTRTGREELTGTIGDGAGRISAESGSGDVRLQKR